MDQQQAPLIGIVGGVGSGKSAVAGWVAEHCHGRLIDADVAGHEVLFQSDVKAALQREFGGAIFVDGEIDRRRLAGLVFGSEPEQAAARSKLERLVHPVMGKMIKDRIDAARQDKHVALVVLDAAILLESGWRDGCDAVAFVDVPREERLRRVAATRGWSSDEFTRREASQWPLDRKREAADVVIDNSGSVEQAGRQLAGYLIGQGWLRTLPQDAGSSRREVDSPALT
ncbi:MAG: dephospho-CoA kinase [Planctomycetaceae bacterium]